MGYVHTRTLCCCIPVRIGAFAIALLGLFWGTGAAVAGILEAKNDKKNVLINRAALTVQIVIYLLLAIVSIVGLVGVIIKRRKFVVLYWIMLVVHLAFSVVASIFSLNALFKDARSNVDQCVGGSLNPNDRSDCQKAMKVTKGVAIGVCVFVWLLEIYGCIIVDSYVKQLADEEDHMYKADTESGPVQ
jgi:amino acid transporter